MATQAPQPPQGMHDHLSDAYRQRLALADRIRAVYAKYGYAPIETPAMERIEVLKGSGGGENEKLMFEVMRRGDAFIDAICYSDIRERLYESLAASLEAIKRIQGNLSGYQMTLDQQQIAKRLFGEQVSQFRELFLESQNMLRETFVDHALRFDLTVPLARLYATHHAKLPPVFRCQHIGPVWRAERPQKGRLREFIQCDVDAVGSSSSMLEAEVILATAEVLTGLLGPGVSIHLNDRRLLTAFLDGAGITKDHHGTALIALDKLDKIGDEGVLKEFQERGINGAVVLSRMKEARAWGWDSPEIKALKEIRDLVGSGANLVFDPFLARGLGYYTGPIFEARMEGAAGSLGGGGRYDGLIGSFLGKDVPAVGFSIGFERLVLLLEERKLRLDASGAPKVFVPFVEGVDRANVFALGALLRSKGLNVVLQPDAGKLIPQLKMADEVLGIPYAAILEPDGKVTVKDLKARKSEPPAAPEAAAACLLTPR